MSTLTESEQKAFNPAELAAETMSSWAGALVTVLESMTGNRPKTEFRAAQSSTLAEGIFWWGQSLSVLDQPSFWIGAPKESWDSLGRLTLSALGEENPSDADAEATCRDLMAQTSAVVAGELAGKLAEAVSGGDSIPGSPPNAAGAVAFTWSLDAGQMSMEGTAVWSDAFLCRCTSFTPQPGEAAAPAEQAPSPSDGDAERFGGRPVSSLPRLDLRVKFVLGRTNLSLREIFKLNTGSVIELESSATEPADMVVHGRVLARGQVVVVNGNYGLKILAHEPQ
jgi:flagellar motor switch protein FliN/FliY